MVDTPPDGPSGGRDIGSAAAGAVNATEALENNIYDRLDAMAAAIQSVTGGSRSRMSSVNNRHFEEPTNTISSINSGNSRIKEPNVNNSLTSILQSVGSEMQDISRILRGTGNDIGQLGGASSQITNAFRETSRVVGGAGGVGSLGRYANQEITGISTAYRQGITKAIMNGINEKSPIRPNDPRLNGATDFGQFLRGKMEPTQRRAMLGSMGRSFDFLGDQSVKIDDAMSAMFAKGKLDQITRSQEFKDSGLNRQDFITFAGTGLEQRRSRQMGQISGLARTSLDQFGKAYEESFLASGHGRGISLDSGGGPTRRSSPTAMSAFLADASRQIQSSYELSSVKGAGSAAARDVERYRGSLGVDILSKIEGSNDLSKKLTEAGILKKGTDGKPQDFKKVLEEVRGSFNAADVKRQELNKLEPGDPGFAKANEAFNAATRLFNDALSGSMGGLNSKNLRKIEGAEDIASLAKTREHQQKTMNYLQGAPMSTMDNLKYGTLQPMAQTAGKFTEMNAMQMQWALMFGFSSPVFSSLTQVPMESSYESIGPLHEGVKNLTGVGAFQQEIMGFASTAPAVMSDLTSRTNTMQSLLGSSMYSKQAVGTALEAARVKPIQFPEAMEVLTAMSIYPGTRPKATDAGFQNKMFDSVQLLTMLAPEQGTGGAVFAVREMLAGQFRSLERRFNISPEIIAGYAGKSMEEFKSAPGTEMVETLNQGLTNMFGGKEVLLKKGAQFDTQLKNVGDTLTSAIIQPMVTKKQKPFIDLLDDQLISDGRGGARLEGSKLARLIPEQQKEMMQGAALERAAASIGEKYKSGDTLEGLKKKLEGDPEKQEKMEASYGRNIKSFSQEQWGTSQGMLALLATGFNQMLEPIMETVGVGRGIAGVIGNFAQPFVQNSESFEKELVEADKKETKSERTKAKTKAIEGFVDSFMSDMSNSVDEAMSGMHSGRWSSTMDSIKKGFGEIGMRTFEPMAQTIMVQSGRAALALPGSMFGGVIEHGIKGAGSTIGELVEGNMSLTMAGAADMGGNLAGGASLLEIGKIFNSQQKNLPLGVARIGGFAMMQKSLGSLSTAIQREKSTGVSNYDDAIFSGLVAVGMQGAIPALGHAKKIKDLGFQESSKRAYRWSMGITKSIDPPPLKPKEFAGTEETEEKRQERKRKERAYKRSQKFTYGKKGPAIIGALIGGATSYFGTDRSEGGKNSWDAAATGVSSLLGMGGAVAMSTMNPVGLAIGGALMGGAYLSNQLLTNQGDEKRKDELLTLKKKAYERLKKGDAITPFVESREQLEFKGQKEMEGMDTTYKMKEKLGAEFYEGATKLHIRSRTFPVDEMARTFRALMSNSRQMSLDKTGEGRVKDALTRDMLVNAPIGALKDDFLTGKSAGLIQRVIQGDTTIIKKDESGQFKLTDTGNKTVDRVMQQYTGDYEKFFGVEVSPEENKRTKKAFKKKLLDSAEESVRSKDDLSKISTATFRELFQIASQQFAYPLKTETIPESATKMGDFQESITSAQRAKATAQQMGNEIASGDNTLINIGLSSGALSGEQYMDHRKRMGGLYARMLKTGLADGRMFKGAQGKYALESMLMNPDIPSSGKGSAQDLFSKIMKDETTVMPDRLEKQIANVEERIAAGDYSGAKAGMKEIWKAQKRGADYDKAAGPGAVKEGGDGDGGTSSKISQMGSIASDAAAKINALGNAASQTASKISGKKEEEKSGDSSKTPEGVKHTVTPSGAPTLANAEQITRQEQALRTGGTINPKTGQIIPPTGKTVATDGSIIAGSASGIASTTGGEVSAGTGDEKILSEKTITGRDGKPIKITKTKSGTTATYPDGSKKKVSNWKKTWQEIKSVDQDAGKWLEKTGDSMIKGLDYVGNTMIEGGAKAFDWASNMLSSEIEASEGPGGSARIPGGGGNRGKSTKNLQKNVSTNEPFYESGSGSNISPYGVYDSKGNPARTPEEAATFQKERGNNKSVLGDVWDWMFPKAEAAEMSNTSTTNQALSRIQRGANTAGLREDGPGGRRKLHSGIPFLGSPKDAHFGYNNIPSTVNREGNQLETLSSIGKIATSGAGMFKLHSGKSGVTSVANESSSEFDPKSSIGTGYGKIRDAIFPKSVRTVGKADAITAKEVGDTNISPHLQAQFNDLSKWAGTSQPLIAGMNSSMVSDLMGFTNSQNDAQSIFGGLISQSGSKFISFSGGASGRTSGIIPESASGRTSGIIPESASGRTGTITVPFKAMQNDPHIKPGGFGLDHWKKQKYGDVQYDLQGHKGFIASEGDAVVLGIGSRSIAPKEMAGGVLDTEKQIGSIGSEERRLGMRRFAQTDGSGASGYKAAEIRASKNWGGVTSSSFYGLGYDQLMSMQPGDKGMTFSHRTDKGETGFNISRGPGGNIVTDPKGASGIPKGYSGSMPSSVTINPGSPENLPEFSGSRRTGTMTVPFKAMQNDPHIKPGGFGLGHWKKQKYGDVQYDLQGHKSFKGFTASGGDAVVLGIGSRSLAPKGMAGGVLHTGKQRGPIGSEERRLGMRRFAQTGGSGAFSAEQAARFRKAGIKLPSSSVIDMNTIGPGGYPKGASKANLSVMGGGNVGGGGGGIGSYGGGGGSASGSSMATAGGLGGEGSIPIHKKDLNVSTTISNLGNTTMPGSSIGSNYISMPGSSTDSSAMPLNANNPLTQLLNNSDSEGASLSKQETTYDKKQMDVEAIGNRKMAIMSSLLHKENSFFPKKPQTKEGLIARTDTIRDALEDGSLGIGASAYMREKDGNTVGYTKHGKLDGPTTSKLAARITSEDYKAWNHKQPWERSNKEENSIKESFWRANNNQMGSVGPTGAPPWLAKGYNESSQTPGTNLNVMGSSQGSANYNEVISSFGAGGGGAGGSTGVSASGMSGGGVVPMEKVYNDDLNAWIDPKRYIPDNSQALIARENADDVARLKTKNKESALNKKGRSYLYPRKEAGGSDKMAANFDQWFIDSYVADPKFRDSVNDAGPGSLTMGTFKPEHTKGLSKGWDPKKDYTGEILRKKAFKEQGGEATWGKYNPNFDYETDMTKVDYVLSQENKDYDLNKTRKERIDDSNEIGALAANLTMSTDIPKVGPHSGNHPVTSTTTISDSATERSKPSLSDKASNVLSEMVYSGKETFSQTYANVKEQAPGLLDRGLNVLGDTAQSLGGAVVGGAKSFWNAVTSAPEDGHKGYEMLPKTRNQNVLGAAYSADVPKGAKYMDPINIGDGGDAPEAPSLLDMGAQPNFDTSFGSPGPKAMSIPEAPDAPEAPSLLGMSAGVMPDISFGTPLADLGGSMSNEAVKYAGMEDKSQISQNVGGSGASASPVAAFKTPAPAMKEEERRIMDGGSVTVLASHVGING